MPLSHWFQFSTGLQQAGRIEITSVYDIILVSNQTENNIENQTTLDCHRRQGNLRVLLMNLSP